MAGAARSARSPAPHDALIGQRTAQAHPLQRERHAQTRPETLVTFGSVGGRPYVPGVPVGTVATVTTQPGSLTPTALVKPFADFTGLGVVGVVVSK